MAQLPMDWTPLTLPARHWKWRMRSAAVIWALEHANTLAQPFDAIFASSYTPLAELLGLAPALCGIPSMLYFHENQFSFPQGPTVTASAAQRDLTYGFTQLTSALAATTCVFNSAHNRDSFLSNAQTVLGKMPQPRPADWVSAIAKKSQVLHVPLELPDLPASAFDPAKRAPGPPRILWNHRWEHDKQPALFFDALIELAAADTEFELIVTGQKFRRSPPCFEAARQQLDERIRHWGYADSRADYEALLLQSDIAVSTAGHEFFGISMLEAAHFGARPLVPDRLAYPETFPEINRYERPGIDGDTLVQRLAALLAGGDPLRADGSHLTDRFRRPALDAIGNALLTMMES